ncbi:MAG: hypothetical protein HJJLKODD_01204 [Phycisphaerae bacterium]|nr:hypothetical protein [Phycisphaerae bacterium]
MYRSYSTRLHRVLCLIQVATFDCAMMMTTRPTMSRHVLRIAAMQVLFQLDVQGNDFLSCAGEFLAERDLDETQQQAVRQWVQQSWSTREQVDEAISTVAQHWEVSRLAGVDRAILRLAVGELLAAQTPPAVVINEAIELAKEFGTAESPQFVNGVLDAVLKRVQGTKGIE